MTTLARLSEIVETLPRRISLKARHLISLIAPLSDETRTSYLLQGVESAWDSAGRQNPQGQKKVTSVLAHRREPDGAPAASPDGATRQKEQGFEGGESLRGAEAMVDVPTKGNNVSSAMSVATFIGEFKSKF